MKIAHVEEEIRGIEQEKKELATELKKKVPKLAIVQSTVDELTKFLHCLISPCGDIFFRITKGKLFVTFCLALTNDILGLIGSI